MNDSKVIELAEGVLTSGRHHNPDGSPANMVDGLYAVAHALDGISMSIDDAGRRLGLNDAATQMGALEAVAKEIGRVADAITTMLT